MYMIVLQEIESQITATVFSLQLSGLTLQFQKSFLQVMSFSSPDKINMAPKGKIIFFDLAAYLNLCNFDCLS